MNTTKNDLGKDEKRDHLLTRRAALMAAAGKPDKVITTELGITQGALEVFKESPLWQQLVGTYADAIEERGVQSLVDELMADAPKNIRFIKQVRDGQFDENKDRLEFRMRAAKMLLDKQAPNADIRAQNESAARIILDGKLLAQILHAMRDVGAIDITPREADNATEDTIPRLLGAKTPEQFALDYNAKQAEYDPDDEL